MELALSPDLMFLRDELALQLKTLKTNRDRVPLKLLQTKYKQGYDALRSDIKEKASEYVIQVALKDIRIHADFVKEGIAIIEEIMQNSDDMKELSYAVFARQDMEEINLLIENLRKQIIMALQPYADGKTVLFEKIAEQDSEKVLEIFK